MHLPLPPPNLRAPSLRVSALLVLAMLGFGVLIGKAARSSGEELTASTREHVRVSASYQVECGRLLMS